MADLIINNFEKIIGGVLAAVFAGYVTYRTYRKTQIHQAAATFRVAIDIDCAIGLYNSFQVDTFRATFAAHKEAARIFRGYLYGFSKSQFSKAWNKYEDWGNKIFTESTHIKPDGTYALTLAHEGRNIKNELSEHLKNLLKFAEKV